MLDLGIVRPGTTIRIPFSTFDKDDGSASAATDYAAADILVFKGGSTTERSSTAGYTATASFDSLTGKNLAIIDLSDNTDAGFYTAGGEYLVAINAITVDGISTGGWIARFIIGYREALYNTTIATLASQTEFTLTAGPAEDDALNDMVLILHDIASSVQFAKVIVTDYTGSTKTVFLAAAPTFTVAAGDNVSVMGLAPLQPATAGSKVTVASGGVLLQNGTGTGQVSLSGGRVNANTTYYNGTPVPAEHTAGYPIVTIKDGTGTGELDTTSGKVSVATGGIAAASFAAGAVDASALATDAVSEIVAAIKALVIETNDTVTLGEAMSVILAACAGVTSSGGSVLKDPSGTSTRITATIDGSNNRTAMTLTPSA
jgi:hypothetical protein